MTLEEAISTFEEWIERDKKIEYADRLENIEIYKQVAEWLKKLKAYEEAEEEITRSRDSGQWSETVVFGLNRAIHIIDKHLKGVNADED